jgi:hypothetical protein
MGELLIGEKKSRIRMNGEEHFRTHLSLISTGNTKEEEEYYFHGWTTPLGLDFFYDVPRSHSDTPQLVGLL